MRSHFPAPSLAAALAFQHRPYSNPWFSSLSLARRCCSRVILPHRVARSSLLSSVILHFPFWSFSWYLASFLFIILFARFSSPFVLSCSRHSFPSLSLWSSPPPPTPGRRLSRPGDMRRTSVSLPTNKRAHDPHEKPARYGVHPHQLSILERTTAWMAQAKQTRWIKAVAVLSAVFFLFYYFSPQGVDLYRGGMFYPLRYPMVHARLFLPANQQQFRPPPALARPPLTPRTEPTGAPVRARATSPSSSMF